jgi:hypothetical protein
MCDGRMDRVGIANYFQCLIDKIKHVWTSGLPEPFGLTEFAEYAGF